MKLAFEFLNGRGLVFGLKDSVPKLVEDEVLLGGGVVTPLLQLELDDFVLNRSESLIAQSQSQLKMNGETLNSSITPAVVEVG